MPRGPESRIRTRVGHRVVVVGRTVSFPVGILCRMIGCGLLPPGSSCLRALVWEEEEEEEEARSRAGVLKERPCCFGALRLSDDPPSPPRFPLHRCCVCLYLGFGFAAGSWPRRHPHPHHLPTVRSSVVVSWVLEGYIPVSDASSPSELESPANSRPPRCASTAEKMSLSLSIDEPAYSAWLVDMLCKDAGGREAMQYVNTYVECGIILYWPVDTYTLAA